jgi:hypothetical protein
MAGHHGLPISSRWDMLSLPLVTTLEFLVDLSIELS